MSLRFLTTLSAATLLLGGVAIAQTSGTTTVPATGKNVEPSTAIQKEEGRSAEEMKAPMGAGAPGVEAKPGSEAGAMPKSNMDPNAKPQ